MVTQIDFTVFCGCVFLPAFFAFSIHNLFHFLFLMLRQCKHIAIPTFLHIPVGHCNFGLVMFSALLIQVQELCAQACWQRDSLRS